jgi:Protein of unknown function (DUF1566)
MAFRSLFEPRIVRATMRYWLLAAAGVTSVLMTQLGWSAVPSACYQPKKGTVYDARTKLTWQQAVDASSRTWDDAKAYCNTLSLEGTGWRVPSLTELHTIVDYSRSNPAIDPILFPDTAPTSFWTSSRLPANLNQAYVVIFNNGYSDAHDLPTKDLVRCVR